jgi:hypothetical protein
LTTYDDIYTEFITNCKTDDINLPQLDEQKYNAIRSAVRHYNNKTGDNLKCDDNLEEVSKELNDNQLIIVAHYLRLAFLENQLIEFATVWQPFAKEVGLKNYADQTKRLETLIGKEEDKIEDIITNADDYIY